MVIGKFPNLLKSDLPTPILPATENKKETGRKSDNNESLKENVSEIEQIVVFFKDGTFKYYHP